MIAIKEVRVVSEERQGDFASRSASSGLPSYHRFVAPLRHAILRTRQWLLSEQQAGGYWEGELEGDSILQSETILLLAYLGREHSSLAQQAAGTLIDQQLSDGGWTLYPGGELDISASVKAYFALKVTGHDPSSEELQRARRAIMAHGGADRVNSFTRFYLALLGQISYDDCPSVPAEMVLLPKWFPIHLYKMSAWSRTIIVPLSIISALRPVRQLPVELGIRELFQSEPRDWPPLSCPGAETTWRARVWQRFFRGVDATIRHSEKLGLLPFRRRAIARAEAWMLERFEGSDGPGAIFPPIVWSTIALDVLGYDQDSRERQYCRRQLEALVLERDDTARLQPCKSPVWDTAITLRALAQSGLDRDHPAARGGIDWLLAKEVRRYGDWSETVQAKAGGWAFEHNNEFYPDLDDTAMVVMALRDQLDDAPNLGDSLPPELQIADERHEQGDRAAEDVREDQVRSAANRGITWMLAMQNRDGGWGAFDRNNDLKALCHVPFADHNAMIDPSCPDVTARVLEALGGWSFSAADGTVGRAISFLRQTQEADGSWIGRWGVNYIYGTWQVLAGLAAVGVPPTDPMVTAACNWLVTHQQLSGGWGETPDSYRDSSLRGQGPETASQTAWALLGLISAGQENHPAVARGIRFLLDTQLDDGTWDEPEFTGTGFPQVFYLRYHMYPIYFPMMALSRWAVAIGSLFDEADTACLRLAESTTAAD
ncbi:MAG: prenyltransferase/squalene oxidase repeat-containing protein [Pirellulales bacterium]